MKQPKRSKSIVDTVMKRLELNDKPERTKRTLVLTKALYVDFEKICRAQKRYPSDVVDELIKLFVEEKQ